MKKYEVQGRYRQRDGTWSEWEYEDDVPTRAKSRECLVRHILTDAARMAWIAEFRIVRWVGEVVE